MKISNGEIITENGGSKIIGNTHIVNDSESPIITKQKILSLDDMLDEVNYDFVGYIPSTHALMFVNFIKEVNAGEEENITPIFHLKMMDQVFNVERRIAVLVFRGGAKSTVLAEYLYLFIASFGFFPGWINMSLGLYVTDSIENGVKNLRRNVEFRYSNSEFLQKLIPNRKIGVGTDGIGYVDPDVFEEQFIGGRKFTDIRLEFKNRNGHQTVIKGFGIACLRLNEKVYLDDNIIEIKDIKIGDKIFGPDGKLTTVLNKSIIHQDKKMYKLTFKDGRELHVTDDHINPLYDGCAKKEINITTENLLKRKLKNIKDQKYYFHTIGIDPLEYSEKEFDIDPYTLGLILGDGYIGKENCGIRINGLKEDIDEYILNIPHKIGAYNNIKTRNNVNTVRISILNIIKYVDELDIRKTGKDKHIPEVYLCGSIRQRYELLKGLMDTDGCIVENGNISFCSISKKMIYQLADIVRSLGGSVTKISEDTKRKNSYGKNTLYRTTFKISENPFKLKRKANKFIPFKNKSKIALIRIEEIPIEPSICIEVDNKSSHFITTNMMKTHNTGVRGVRELGVRPSLGSLDDLISSDDAARSSTILQSIKSTIYKDVSKALHPTKQKIVYVGTPFNELDPLVEALNSKSWKRVVFPICEHFDSKTTKKEFKGAWEERFPFEYVKAEYDEAMDLGNPSYFFQELMLQISSEDDRLILNSDICWYDDVCEVIDNKQNYNFYIYTDFATSERKTSDYSIISVFAYGDDKKFRWVDGTMAKQDMWENIKDLFRLVKEYSPMGVGIEVSGQQGGFIPWIYREMNERNIFFNIASENNDGKPGIRPVTNKFARFNVVLPYFKQKKIMFPTNMKSDPRLLHAVNELSRITNAGIKSKTDDFIDTVSQIPMIPVFEPQVKKTNVIVSDEDADLRDKYFPRISISEEKEKTDLSSYIR